MPDNICPQNRIKQQLDNADRTIAWLSKKLNERGLPVHYQTVRKWAFNHSQPALGYAACIADILKIPLNQLVQADRGQTIQDEIAKEDLSINKLDQKFKK